MTLRGQAESKMLAKLIATLKSYIDGCYPENSFDEGYLCGLKSAAEILEREGPGLSGPIICGEAHPESDVYHPDGH